jgi:hypothetical protein
MPTISAVTGPRRKWLEVAPGTGTPFVNHWKRRKEFVKVSS